MQSREVVVLEINDFFVAIATQEGVPMLLSRAASERVLYLCSRWGQPLSNHTTVLERAVAQIDISPYTPSTGRFSVQIQCLPAQVSVL